jgi:hypothetical protein
LGLGFGLGRKGQDPFLDEGDVRVGQLLFGRHVGVRVRSEMGVEGTFSGVAWDEDRAIITTF